MTFSVNNLLLLIVFLTPLLGATGNFGFELIKVAFFLLSISLIGFLWMGKGVKWTGISKAAGLFTAILLVTSLTGLDPRSSLLGREPYFQGWVLYAYLFLFYLMVKTFPIEIKKYAVIICVSAFLVSFLAIKDWILLNIFNIQVLTYAGRVVSSFGQPNFFAGFLLLSLPFSYLLFRDSDRRWQFLGWGSGLIAMVGILISYSRSAILLALLLLLLVLFSSLSSRRMSGSINNIINWIHAFAGMTVLVLVITVFLSIHFSSGLVGSEVSRPLATQNPDLTKESVEKRVYIWPQAFTIALQKPVLGYGLENIDKSFVDYFKQNQHAIFEENLQISPVLISLKELNIDRSHNYLLDLLLFSGGAGLLAWLILVSLLFWKLKQKTDGRQKGVLLIGLLTYLVWIQFQNQSIVHLIYHEFRT